MSAASRVDGRALRRERSLERIAEAYLDLLTEGALRPTADQLAARAGVSRRLIFSCYANLEELFAAVITRQAARLQTLVEAAEGPGTFEVRVRRFVKARVDLYEEIAPVRRAALLSPHGSPRIREALAAFRAHKRAQATRVFAPELARWSGAAGRQRRAAAHALTSFSGWSALHVEQGTSSAETRAILRRALRALLLDEAAR